VSQLSDKRPEPACLLSWQESLSSSRVSPRSKPLTLPSADGRLGLCYLPGKQTLGRNGTFFRRDVEADLTRLRQVHGAHLIVCLLPEAELRVRSGRGVGKDGATHTILEYLVA
jgi:cyclin-dependent kinase inhibitor 3